MLATPLCAGDGILVMLTGFDALDASPVSVGWPFIKSCLCSPGSGPALAVPAEVTAALMAHCSVADANPFLQSVHRCMTSRLLQLPDKHSVTALLNTWAQSIHQACLSAA